MSHTVTSCADDFNTPGTLRWTLADPSTHSGDTVDLSQLTCSHITLGSELKVHQDDLTLLGPGPDAGVLTLDAYMQSEIIQHFGYGTLELQGLEIRQGYFASTTDPTGGCIWSRGTISLVDSNVHHCQTLALSAAAPTFGGAIYVKGSLKLTRSTISDSNAYANAGGSAAGGGAFVKGSLTADSSSITNNAARAIGGVGKGGGAFVRGTVDVASSTVSHNRADVGGGLALYAATPSISATLSNSTVSGNTAFSSVGGVYSTMPLKLINSTIAFNRATDASSTGAGIFAEADLEMTSSIVADNATGAGSSDIDGTAGVAVTGSKNLVQQSGPHVSVPIDTIDDCPKLDVLTQAEGPTATHRPGPMSSAIDRGLAAGTLLTDQRGLPRVSGPNADIGSVERQPAELDERIFLGAFDVACDYGAW
jgi:hypothetical protein